MTSTSILEREIRRGQAERESQFEKFKGRLLCQIVRVNGNLKVPRKPGFVWVQEYSPSSDDPPFHVFNSKVQRREGLPVWVGRGLSGRLEILDWYNGVLPDMPSYDGQVYLPNHAPDHEWPDKQPGPDAVTVYPRALSMLRTYPGEAGGLTISVTPLRYIVNGAVVEFPGLSSYDISGSQPASGSALYVGVYLDKSTNTIGTVDGSSVIDATTIEPPSPTFPSLSIPSGLVRLDGDQTSITEADTGKDPRMFLGDVAVGEAQSIKADLLKQIGALEAQLDMIISKHMVEG